MIMINNFDDADLVKGSQGSQTLESDLRNC